MLLEPLPCSLSVRRTGDNLGLLMPSKMIGAGGGGGQGEPEHEARGTCWPAGTVQRGGCGGTVHPLPQKCQVGPWPTWQPVYTLGELTAGGFLGGGTIFLSACSPHILSPAKGTSPLFSPNRLSLLVQSLLICVSSAPQEVMVKW